jgi:hypothetical protein
LRRRGRRRYRFFAFLDVKKRGFACKLSKYALAGRLTKLVLLRRRGRRRYRFFAFLDVKKRGFACKLSRYALAGRPSKGGRQKEKGAALGRKPGQGLMGDVVSGWGGSVHLMKEILGSFLPPFSVSLEKTGR